MGLGTVLIISAAVAAAIMLVGIADVLRLGRRRFAAAGRRRTDWILLFIFIGPFAVVLYAAAVRPQVLHPERYSGDAADTPADAPAGGLDNAAVGGHA